jgi:hypothetical protein
VLGEICELLREFCVVVNRAGFLEMKLTVSLGLLRGASGRVMEVIGVDSIIAAQDLHKSLQKPRSAKIWRL